MPTLGKPSQRAGRARAPVGKKQALLIIDADLIKQIKLAAVEDEKKMSHIFEQAAREWLAKRKTRGGIKSK